MSQVGRGPRSTSLWWAHPAIAVPALVVPTLLLAQRTTPERYLRAWRTLKWFDDDTMRVLLAATVVLVGGSLLGSLMAARRRQSPTDASAGPPGAWPALAPATQTVLRAAFVTLYRLTVAAYVIWAVVLTARGTFPGAILDLLRSGEIYSSTYERAGIAGITTLTQVGIAAVIVGTLVDLGGRDRRVRRALIVLFLLGSARALLFSERLAVVELVIPWAVLRAAAAASHRRRPLKRVAALAAPLVAIPALVLVFAAFEFTRSWTYFSDRTDQSLISFSSERLVGYYATSYNNGEILRQHYDWPERLPKFTVEFFWELPVLDQFMDYESATERDGNVQMDLLATYGNPEFNSPCGLMSPIVDFGLLPGLGVLAGAGVALGVLYQWFRRRRPAGLLFYPVLFTGLLELPREVYWTLGRTVPAYLALLWVLHRLATRRPLPGATPAPLDGPARPGSRPRSAELTPT